MGSIKELGKKGFSLVELTITVGILAMVSVIAQQQYSEMRDRTVVRGVDAELAQMRGLIEGIGASEGNYPDTGILSWINNDPNSPYYIPRATVALANPQLLWIYDQMPPTPVPYVQESDSGNAKSFG